MAAVRMPLPPLRSLPLPRSLTLPPEPESVGTVRRFVADCCADWSAGPAGDAARLIASELVTNAIRYAGTPVTVSLARRHDGVVVHVQDGSSRPLVRPHPAPMADAGRGLFLVADLARRWGTTPVGRGKRVWAEVAD